MGLAHEGSCHPDSLPDGQELRRTLFLSKGESHFSLYQAFSRECDTLIEEKHDDADILAHNYDMADHSADHDSGVDDHNEDTTTSSSSAASSSTST